MAFLLRTSENLTEFERSLSVLEERFLTRMKSRFVSLIAFDDQISSEPISTTASKSRLSKAGDFILREQCCIDTQALKYSIMNGLARFIADRFVSLEEYFSNAVYILGIRPEYSVNRKLLSISTWNDHERMLRMIRFDIRIRFHDSRVFGAPLTRQMGYLMEYIERAMGSRIFFRSNSFNLFSSLGGQILKQFSMTARKPMKSRNFDIKAKELLGEAL